MKTEKTKEKDRNESGKRKLLKERMRYNKKRGKESEKLNEKLRKKQGKNQ